MRGLRGAAQSPHNADFTLNEAGLRPNIRYSIGDFDMQGLFVISKQRGFSSMSLQECKLSFEIELDECAGKADTFLSCTNWTFARVIEQAHHTRSIGADWIVVHAPVLHFITDRKDTLFTPLKKICDRVAIAIAKRCLLDRGCAMSSDRCAQISDRPNIMAITHSVRVTCMGREPD